MDVLDLSALDWEPEAFLQSLVINTATCGVAAVFSRSSSLESRCSSSHVVLSSSGADLASTVRCVEERAPPEHPMDLLNMNLDQLLQMPWPECFGSSVHEPSAQHQPEHTHAPSFSRTASDAIADWVRSTSATAVPQGAETTCAVAQSEAPMVLQTAEDYLAANSQARQEQDHHTNKDGDGDSCDSVHAGSVATVSKHGGQRKDGRVARPRGRVCSQSKKPVALSPYAHCITIKAMPRRVLVCCDACEVRNMTRYCPGNITHFRTASTDVVIPQACDVCGGGLDAPVLRANLETYKCLTCGQDCGRGDRLLAHSSRHTKIKSFFCDLCPRNFSRASRLVDHKHRFHGPESVVSASSRSESLVQA